MRIFSCGKNWFHMCDGVKHYLVSPDEAYIYAPYIRPTEKCTHKIEESKKRLLLSRVSAKYMGNAHLLTTTKMVCHGVEFAKLKASPLVKKCECRIEYRDTTKHGYNDLIIVYCPTHQHAEATAGRLKEAVELLKEASVALQLHGQPFIAAKIEKLLEDVDVKTTEGK